MTHVVALLVVLALTGVVALAWRALEGRVTTPLATFTPAQRARLDLPEGKTVLLEFTAPACAPCAIARRVLEDVAAADPGVVVRVVDVADALDVARAHHVLRAPTVFVLAPDGEVLARISGVPDADGLVALVSTPAAV